MPSKHEDFQVAQHTPPWFADPRRIGSVIALIGSLVFVFSYSDGVSVYFAWITKLLVMILALTAAFFLFVRRRWLGPFQPPSKGGIVIYLICVSGELGLIAAGTTMLISHDLTELRPALIAMVVGIHFIPFAWAFNERMFYLLGGTLTAIGIVGLLSSQGTWALVAASTSGLFMASVIIAYALGTFARTPSAR